MQIADTPTTDRMKLLLEARARWERMTPEQRAAVYEADRADRARELREGLRLSMRARCGLRDAMWDHRLDTYTAHTESQRKALQAVQRLAEVFPGTRGAPVRRGLYLWGEPGAGKSGLMQGLVQAILEKPRIYSVLYIPCVNVESLRQKVDLEFAAREAQLVILDDLTKGLDEPGSRYRSPGDGILRRIIHDADRYKRPIICATDNISIAQHAEASRSLGGRLAGLMYEMHIEGPDMRRPSSDETDQDGIPYWAD